MLSLLVCGFVIVELLILDQTTYLPEADRLSLSLKECNAQIDVCMGGRVAEAISTSSLLEYVWLTNELVLVYGIDNVTTGATSDLQQATRTATAMVKVRSSSLILWRHV